MSSTTTTSIVEHPFSSPTIITFPLFSHLYSIHLSHTNFNVCCQNHKKTPTKKTCHQNVPFDQKSPDASCDTNTNITMAHSAAHPLISSVHSVRILIFRDSKKEKDLQYPVSGFMSGMTWPSRRNDRRLIYYPFAGRRVSP